MLAKLLAFANFYHRRTKNLIDSSLLPHVRPLFHFGQAKSDFAKLLRGHVQMNRTVIPNEAEESRCATSRVTPRDLLTSLVVIYAPFFLRRRDETPWFWRERKRGRAVAKRAVLRLKGLRLQIENDFPFAIK